MENYEQFELIGRGTMSRVYMTRYRIPNAKESLIIKRYVDAARGESAAKLRETMNQLSFVTKKVHHHSNLVRIIDCAVDGNDICVVMNYAVGGSVYDLLTGMMLGSNTPSISTSSSSSVVPSNTNASTTPVRSFSSLPQEAILYIAYQLADAIEYLHSNGIIHRNIKPENVLLDTTTSDEGTRSSTSSTKSPSSSSLLNSTSTVFHPSDVTLPTDIVNYDVILSDYNSTVVWEGALQHTSPHLIGTRSYTAPEILCEEPYDKPVDIWSYGATLFTLVTGLQIGGQAKERTELMKGTWSLKEFMNRSSIEAQEKWKNLNKPLRVLIKKCLVLNPSDRLTIDQIIHDSVCQDARKKREEKLSLRSLFEENIRTVTQPLIQQIRNLERENMELKNELRIKDEEMTGLRRNDTTSSKKDEDDETGNTETGSYLEKLLHLQKDIQNVLEKKGSSRTMKQMLDRAKQLGLTEQPVVQTTKTSSSSHRRRQETTANRSNVTMGKESGSSSSSSSSSSTGTNLDYVVSSLDDKEMKSLRTEKLQQAAKLKYNFTKYGKIRSTDDYARGIFLNTKIVKAYQLRWQENGIPNSLLDYSSKDLVKFAITIHKNILGYADFHEESTEFAEDILQKGLQYPELADEIYVQLCKHLTYNPYPASTARGWQLLCMCIETFPPSRNFENYFLNFLLEHKENGGMIGHYAKFALRRVEGIINSGPSGVGLSIDEITAYSDRPPILVTITLIDGTVLTVDLPLNPSVKVSSVIELCNHFMELKDERMEYSGIFVVDDDIDDEGSTTGKDHETGTVPPPPYAGLPRTSRPLQNHTYMGDAVTINYRKDQVYRFVYKRKIYFKETETIDTTDPAFIRLTYLQCVDEVLHGNLKVKTEEDMVRMVAIAIRVKYGDKVEDNKEWLTKKGVVTKFIPENYRSTKDTSEWIKLIMKMLRNTVPGTQATDTLQKQYIAMVNQDPLYGSCFFHVRKNKFPERFRSFPTELLVALNSEGIHIVNAMNREKLVSFEYADIYRWFSYTTVCNILVYNPETEDIDEVSVFTRQAADIVGLILDYLSQVGKEEEDEDDGKVEDEEED